MASCASPGLAHMEDRFSDCELSDMLAFFDRHDNGFSSCPLAQADAGLGLPVASSDAEEPAAEPVVVPKQEQSGTSSPVTTSTSTAMPSYPAMGCGLLGSRTTVVPGAALLMAGNGALFCAMPQALQAQDYSASVQQAAQQSSKDSKLTVSHSTIEKQRRDRINSLIDELRELVPSIAGTMKGPDGADMKRPKHVVLSDTISLLKALKERAEKDQQQLQNLKQLLATSNGSCGAAFNGEAAAANAAAVADRVLTAEAAAAAAIAAANRSSASAQSLLQHSLSSSVAQTAAAPAAAAAAAGQPAACPELPQAPAHLPASVGVLVEEGPGCFLVKVNCKDRHGLLSDITGAIGGLPLQITRAAITTSHGGAVYDVFEIVVEPDADLDGVTALDIQFQVHQALHKYKRAQAARAAAAAARQEQPSSSESQNDSGSKVDAKRRRSE